MGKNSYPYVVFIKQTTDEIRKNSYPYVVFIKQTTDEIEKNSYPYVVFIKQTADEIQKNSYPSVVFIKQTTDVIQKNSYPSVVIIKKAADHKKRLHRRQEMTVVYPVIFTQTNDKKDTYLIEIPDLGGITEGHGIADAVHMARDYIGCALYDKEDYEIPVASKIKDVDPLKGRFSDNGESIISVVDVDIEVYKRKMQEKAVRKNVSLPAWLAAEAEKAHVNLSRVLQDALKEKLNIA